MSEDARFEDAQGVALRLAAESAEDLQVISSLCQDAVFLASEMTFEKGKRRFAVLLNRFRWEEDQSRPERVQSVLSFDAVSGVRSQGIDRTDDDQIYSLLMIELGGSEMAQHATLVLAGDGEIELLIEAISVSLVDVTKPYEALSGQRPDHKTD
ncbi:MAG: DUF2948 family protein [Pseudomonadota bacterium]